MVDHNQNIILYIQSLIYDAKIPEKMPHELSSIEGMADIDIALRALREAIKALGLGDLSEKIQGKGYTFGIVKNLQSILKNLTWQTKAISSGDFSQRVDFLGDFSVSFNDMVKKLETALLEVKEARDLFKMFFETIPDATIIISAQNWEILDCNRAFENMTGYTKTELNDKTLNEIRFFKDSTQEALFSTSVGKKVKASNILLELEFENKALIYGLFSSDTIVIEKEKYMLIVINDITERKHMEEEIRRLSETDPLTQINNRLKLDSALNIEIEKLLKKTSACSVIILDIDNFKDVNDTHGHLIGDEVLKEFADIIRTSVRKIDIVGRWGGEEFMIILPLTDVNGAQILAEKLRAKISEFKFTGVGNLTASFGVAETRGELNKIEVVFKADSAMYKAKKSGKNCVRVSRF